MQKTKYAKKGCKQIGGAFHVFRISEMGKRLFGDIFVEQYCKKHTEGGEKQR